MCLIIETRNDIVIPKFVMADMYKRNDDGYGFMYIRNGHTVGEKYEGKTTEELYEKYLELKEFEPYIHLRMKTHGDINSEQSHPFYCGHGIWMMHNGILSDTQGVDTSKSDTWYFANEYLKPLFDQARDPEELLKTAAFQRLINKFIGGGNRIVMLSRNIPGLRFNDGQWHTIHNEETQCVGMKVSNTYAWNLYQKSRPIVHQHSGENVVHYDNRFQRARQSSVLGDDTTSTVVSPPGMAKSDSKPNDPAGSFRDASGELWIYNGVGWMMYKHHKALHPDAPETIYTKFGGSEGVSQSHPTCPKTGESGSSNNGTVLVNEKSSESLKKEQWSRRRRQVPSFIEAEAQALNDEYEYKDEKEASEKLQDYSLDLYQDYLYDEWSTLDYKGICEKVLEDPEGAADLIAFSLCVKIDVDNGAPFTS